MQGNSVVPPKFYGLSRISLALSGVNYYLLPTSKCKLSLWGSRFFCSFAPKPEKSGLLLFKVHATAAETNQPKWWEKNVGPNMIDIHSTQEFVDALGQAGDGLVIVEFFGTWLAEQHPEIIFLKVNFDENKTLCKSLNIKVLPYFHFYRGADGLVDSFSCSLAKLQKLKDAIATHNKVLHNGNPSIYNGGASDLPGLSLAPDDKAL